MVNDATDARVEERDVNSIIKDLAKPIVEYYRGIARTRDKGVQVVVLFDRLGQRDMTIYHDGPNAPKYKQYVEYEYRRPEWLAQRRTALLESYLDGEMVLGQPRGLDERIELNIPFPERYRFDPYERLDERDARYLEETGRQRRNITIEPVSRHPEPWETPYFYKVTYRKQE